MSLRDSETVLVDPFWLVKGAASTPLNGVEMGLNRGCNAQNEVEMGLQ